MLLVRRSVVAVVSVRAFVRSVSWLATDAAHTALDVVEHVVNCYAPLPVHDHIHVPVCTCTDKSCDSCREWFGAEQLADAEESRDSWEPGEVASAAYLEEVGATISDEYRPAYEAAKARKSSPAASATSAGDAPPTLGERGGGPTAVDSFPPKRPAVGHQPNDWINWATPAICEVLAEHHLIHEGGSQYTCCAPGEAAHTRIWDQQAWREHVAPLIANHLATAWESR